MPKGRYSSTTLVSYNYMRMCSRVFNPIKIEAKAKVKRKEEWLITTKCSQPNLK